MERKPDIEWLIRESGVLGHLGVEFSDLSPERVVATMLVDERHQQPPGLLHGGMSVALAESVAVAGAWLNCPPGKVALGSSVNASYIRSKRTGSRLWAVGIPEFVGPDKQLWEVDVRDEAGDRVCAFRWLMLGSFRLTCSLVTLIPLGNRRPESCAPRVGGSPTVDTI